MQDYLIVIFFSLIGGLFSLIGGILLLSRRSLIKYVQVYAVPFAAGALLAAVFIDLLPDGLEESDPQVVLKATLLGIVLFFLGERFLRWFHHHHEDDKNRDPTVSLIIVGDILHNALDGIAIAAAFLVSVPTGIVTTLAVAAHEIPQEIGDFGLLLSKGLSRAKVLLINVLSALTTTIVAVFTYSLGSDDKLPVGVLLGLSAGFILYIALSDIIPTIHQKVPAKKLVQTQTVLLLVGIIVVGMAVELAHEYINIDEDKNSQSSQQQNSSSFTKEGQDYARCLEMQEQGYKIACPKPPELR